LIEKQRTDEDLAISNSSSYGSGPDTATNQKPQVERFEAFLFIIPQITNLLPIGLGIINPD